jgi:hypothetical protein
MNAGRGEFVDFIEDDGLARRRKERRRRARLGGEGAAAHKHQQGSNNELHGRHAHDGNWVVGGM